ncbi:cytochrome P450 [Novosphingobium album (ex Liu et al. 2023)]|uniref:Cytochrome P450 n=1 Tax=Novosphingobium album (ex Liu et al. 2023) TaxID=3031130 RepID=A0ABT5WWY6_9SPHN|nr:cytochrome P450 [Novosphingobium album (ex Liu et al. 2023)]MDE8654417.1 cytochrome P450 [Novosphingobium album (ex Liu et al. 2023)]
MAIDAAHPVPPNLPRRVGMDQVPDHVPPELIRTAGITFGPDFLKAPHDFMAAMHEDYPPLFYDVSPFGNMWTAIKHEDALFVLRHPDIFSNEGATPFPRDPDDYFYFIPIEIDPPHHRKYRNIVDPTFSPKGVLKLEGLIRQRAKDLLDEFADKGECEFTTEFGRPLPVSVFLDIMGLPQDMRDTFVSWAVDLLHSNDREIMGRSMRSITEYLKQAIAEKKAHPDDGVVSLIANSAPDGVPLSDKEIFGFVCFLFIGGLDTVFATLNNVWLYLAEHPEKVREIIARPDDIDKVVEELLRRWSVTFSGRVLAQDYEMRGVKMKAGDRITCLLPACNFDPEVFPNPKEVDFDRPRKTILAFTVGVHSCMGAHLARLEVKIALQEWLKRVPQFALKPGAHIEYRPGGVVGPEHLPLVW